MAELVRGGGVEVDGASHRVEGGITDGEAQAVGRLGVELNVVVEDRACLVKPWRELEIAIAVGIGHHRDGRRHVGITVAVNVIAVDESRILDQVH